MPPKAFLDTCVINWFLDDTKGPALLAKFTDGTLQAFVFPEVSKEIYDTPNHKAERLERLKSILRLFLPVLPTVVPVAGLARAGAARSAPAGADALRADLKSMGLRKLDIIHLMNAHYSNCDLFITNDKEDILKRKGLLTPRLGFRILHPADLLIELNSV